MKITDTHVYFYSTKDVFSNFYPVDFTDGGKFLGEENKFNSSEQAYMFYKACFFKDYDTAKLILEETVPANQKKLGRQVANYDDYEWRYGMDESYEAGMTHSLHAMYTACYHKFSVLELQGVLLSTGDRILVEASPADLIWGVGLRENDPRILDPMNWTGTNHLGQVLMQVRKAYAA